MSKLVNVELNFVLLSAINPLIFFEATLNSYNVLFKEDFSDVESFIDKKLRYIKLNNINNESKATDT